jgi:hypothetical protein
MFKIRLCREIDVSGQSQWACARTTRKAISCSHISFHFFCHGLVIGFLAIPAALIGQITTNQLDPAIVLQKIQALGIRDDTVPEGQQPRTWLHERREQVTRQLIAALDGPNTNQTTGCLAILNGTTGSPELVAALVRIAGDAKHPLSRPSTFGLCRFAEDDRARIILKAAIDDALRFPDAEHRATFAEALGEKKKAVELLSPLLNEKYDCDVCRIIKRLETVADPAAIGPLEQASHDPRGRVATQAYLTLAKIDPTHHALTTSQREFLENVGRSLKADKEFYLKRQQKLAALPRSELRPFVMQLLTSDDCGNDALGILRIWGDKEAQTEIRRLMHEKKSWRAIPFITAYLEIDGTDSSAKEVLALLEHQDDFRRVELMRGVVQVELSLERKLALLRLVRDRFGAQEPSLVPHSLNWMRSGRDEIVAQLFAEETSLPALGAYAERMPASCTNGLLRALQLVAASSDDTLARNAIAVRIIFERCAEYAIAGSGTIADKLLLSPNMEIQLAAAGVAAKLGGDRGRALGVVYAALPNHEQAALTLLGLPCRNEAERAEREAVVLKLLGSPSEEFVLRVLTTCGGNNSVVALKMMLDDPSAHRALHAAWVLAQLPDKVAAQQALRRVAIYALFYHQMYQQGSGIDFPIVRGLSFHQPTGWLNSQHQTVQPPAPVVIPSGLMVPRQLDESEQAFVVRSYRAAVPGQMLQQHILSGWHRDLDASYLPLLRVIARDDPDLAVLHVKGRRVAHFPQRKAAAEVTARLTGRPASYLGLNGEEMDSAALPLQPYLKQEELVAGFILDRIVAADLLGRPQTDAEWNRREPFNRIIQHLTDPEKFGAPLSDEFLRLSQERQLSEKLKNAGFAQWLN